MKEVYAVIAGGGTGGHVYPALAVAEELVRRGHPAESIRFLGSARGLEAEAVPAAGYEIALLPGRGFRRSLRPEAIAQNVRTAADVGQAVRAHKPGDTIKVTWVREGQEQSGDATLGQK